MSSKGIIKQIKAAKVEVARTALTTPFAYQEANEVMEAREELRIAQARLARAEKAWAALIRPAAGWAPDPLAIRKAASKEGGAA